VRRKATYRGVFDAIRFQTLPARIFSREIAWTANFGHIRTLLLRWIKIGSSKMKAIVIDELLASSISISAFRLRINVFGWSPSRRRLFPGKVQFFLDSLFFSFTPEVGLE
jgi:hypothetical protein